MKRIRARPRLDNLINQQRASATISWGKWIYLLLLGLMAVIGLNYVFGDSVFLRADGIVLTDRYVVAATYSGRVSAVRVKEGDAVNSGATLMEVESADMLKDIADLATRVADLAVRETQLKVRQSTVAALLPLAERHTKETAEQVSRMDSVAGRGVLSAQYINQALTSGYETASKLAELRGQSETLAGELQLVQKSHRRAADALDQLEAFYDKGSIHSPVEGHIGAKVPSPGQVVRFGDEIMQVNGNASYVLAYLPDMYLFKVQSGDRVRITSGTTSVSGTIDAILSVADALPAEFQNMFRPRDRSRLIRVSLPANHGLAVSQKIQVRGTPF